MHRIKITSKAKFDNVARQKSDAGKQSLLFKKWAMKRESKRFHEYASKVQDCIEMMTEFSQTSEDSRKIVLKRDVAISLIGLAYELNGKAIDLKFLHAKKTAKAYADYAEEVIGVKRAVSPCPDLWAKITV